MTCLLLFYEFFKTGLFAVGGGLATLPFLYDMAARHPEWFTVSQLADMLAVSESTPGPLGVNMATYVGYLTAGIPGAVAATMGLVAPSVIVILIVAAFLKRFRESRLVNNVFYGLRPASAAMVAAAGLSVVGLALLYSGQAGLAAVNWKAVALAAVLLVLLTAVVLFATGIAGSSVAALKDLTDTARIALLPGSGWPQQTGVAELEQMAPLTGSFVELGDEGCVVWSRTGKKLNSIQSGYARPALAAGKTRFVLYNRSGNELRVESRTQNLYTKQLENSIFLCAMSDNGTLAVVTEDQTSMAKLLVYSPSMEQQLSWSMTSNDGTPLRMAFSPDSRKLAAAAVTVSGGQVMTNLYLINLASGDPVSLVNQGGVPQWLGWTSASTILAVYDTRAVLYNAGGGERAVYDFAGTELKDVSVDAAGNVALLLASGQVSQAVTLDKNLNVQFSAAVSAANSIVRAGNLFYLLADNAVECFDASGTQQWSQNLDTSPQALLANSKDLLLFSGNTVQKLEAPAE